MTIKGERQVSVMASNGRLSEILSRHPANTGHERAHRDRKNRASWPE